MLSVLRRLVALGVSLAAFVGVVHVARVYHLIERINDRSPLPFCDQAEVLAALADQLHHNGARLIEWAQPNPARDGNLLSSAVKAQFGKFTLTTVDLTNVSWDVHRPDQVAFNHQALQRECSAVFRWRTGPVDAPIGQDIFWGYVVLGSDAKDWQVQVGVPYWAR